MPQDVKDLLDSIVDGFISDVEYELDISTRDRAAELILESLERLKNNDSSLLPF